MTRDCLSDILCVAVMLKVSQPRATVPSALEGSRPVPSLAPGTIPEITTRYPTSISSPNSPEIKHLIVIQNIIKPLILLFPKALQKLSPNLFSLACGYVPGEGGPLPLCEHTTPRTSNFKPPTSVGIPPHLLCCHIVVIAPSVTSLLSQIGRAHV